MKKYDLWVFIFAHVILQLTSLAVLMRITEVASGERKLS